METELSEVMFPWFTGYIYIYFLESSSLCSQYILYFQASLSFPLEGTAHNVSLCHIFFWACITRKKEKTCSVGVFPDKSSNTHIWLILVLFRRRKSGGVGLGFVCVAFFSGLSYHTQAQPLPLELARCLWVVLVLLMQWVFSSCIAGCCSREKPGAFLVPELLWREILGHGLPLFQHSTKVQNYQGIGICLISASWQKIK